MSQLKYLDIDPEEIVRMGAMDTAREIAGQPALWREVFNMILERKKDIEDFLAPLLAQKNLRIILTGAGSSAFIGESTRGILQTETGRLTQAIATTDLVTHPQLYFLRKVPTLLMSFARSGNSPESVEAVNLANNYCDHIHHFIITCNREGQLVKHNGSRNNYALILPEQANDKSLAMTGSFTSMLLSVLLIAGINRIESLRPELETAVENTEKVIREYLPIVRDLAKKEYERVIFLGSGPLLGIARECQLKLQELTDGQVICKHDSFLGFRHGPRAVTNEKSLMVFFFSDENHVFSYERDLAISIAGESPFVPAISFGRNIPGLKNILLDIEFDRSGRTMNGFYCLPATVFGQLYGFCKSVQLGLRPDNPSVQGKISRVVEGVTIYPMESVSAGS